MLSWKEEKKMKKKVIIVTAIVLIALGITAAVLFCNSKKSDGGLQNNNEKPMNTYLVITINPKVMLHLDKNGQVIEIFMLNEDAKIFANAEIKGLALESALKKIYELATTNNYLKDDKLLNIAIIQGGNSEFLDTTLASFKEKGADARRREIPKNEETELLKVTQNKPEQTTKVPQNNSTSVTTSSASKTTKKATTTTTKKPEFNLNDGLSFAYSGLGGRIISDTCWNDSAYAGDFWDKEECYVSKTIKLSGKGYYCINYNGKKDEWECNYITINQDNKTLFSVSTKTMESLAKKNKLFVTGMGADDFKPLTEKICKAYNLSCGSW